MGVLYEGHGKVISRSQQGQTAEGGVIPHQITFMSPLPDMAEMDQITGRLSCSDQ